LTAGDVGVGDSFFFISSFDKEGAGAVGAPLEFCTFEGSGGGPDDFFTGAGGGFRTGGGSVGGFIPGSKPNPITGDGLLSVGKQTNDFTVGVETF